MVSNEIDEVLCKAIDSFLESIPSDVRYYGTGGNVEIPTSAELELVRVFEESMPRSRADLASSRRKLDLRQANRLGAFALRMATLAVRRSAVHIISAGILGMVIDDDLIGCRSVLIGLSVIEDCALRLGVNLEFVVRDATTVASEPRRETIVDYLSRSPALRGIRIMKIEAIGDGPSLMYRPL